MKLNLQEFGISLSTDRLAHSKFLDMFGRLISAPCREATRIAVSTRQHKAQVAAAIANEMTRVSSLTSSQDSV